MGRLKFLWKFLSGFRKSIVAVCGAMSNLGWLPESIRSQLGHFIPLWDWTTWLLWAVIFLASFIVEEAHYLYLVQDAKQRKKIPPQRTNAVPIAAIVVIVVFGGVSVIRYHRRVPALQATSVVHAPAASPMPPSAPASTEPASTTPRHSSREHGKSSKPIQTPDPRKPEAPNQATPSISQSNSGGVNVQQGTTGDNSPIVNSPINIGSLPKRISPQDMATIKQYLSECSNKARLEISVDQTSNAMGFADDFYHALKDAGWSMQQEGPVSFLGFSPPGKRFQGAVVTLKGQPTNPGETLYFPPSDPMSYVGKVLESLKVPVVVTRNPKVEEGVISIQFTGFPD